MENTTSNFTSPNQTTLFSATTDITHNFTDNFLAPTLLSNSRGWTETVENVSETLVELSTFCDTDYDANFTLMTPHPTEAGEGLPLNTGQITIAVLSCFCSFVTVFGNLLVLCAFCAERRLRTYINYYIVGLSFADLVAGVFTMPLYTVYWVLGYWPFSATLCDIYLYLNHVFIHISLLAILILAIDRYQAVYHPLQHLQKRTLRHASFMISISYLIPFLLWLPYTILWPYIVGVRRIRPGFCYPQYVVDSLTFSIMAPVFFFWIPAPTISVLYWRIYVIIQRKSSQRKGPVMMQDLESTSNSNSAKEGEAVTSNRVQAVSHPEHDATIPGPNADIASGFGHENPGFESDKDENADNLHNNTVNSDIGGQSQNTHVPNASHLHSQQNQLPILDFNKNKTHQVTGTDAEQRRKQPRTAPASTKRVNREGRESHRATRTLTLIFIVLIVSSLPWSVLVIIYCICPRCIPLILYQASVYIAHMNSTVNPFCYAVANPLYVQAFTRLVCCGRRTKHRDRRSPNTQR